MDSEIEKCLEGVEKALSKLRKALETEDTSLVNTNSWFYRMGRMLWEIASRGAEVTTEDFYAIGEELGYDHRGLGGFFTGTFSSLEMVSGTRNRRLTAEGKAQAERWFARYGAPPA